MGIKQRVLGRIMQWWAPRGGLAQFHQPTGAVGHVAGWIMGRRSSNVARNRWAVQLLDVADLDQGGHQSEVSSPPSPPAHGVQRRSVSTTAP